MPKHTCEPAIISIAGPLAAIIIDNIYFWAVHNAKNNKHIHEGSAWTYNSLLAFTKIHDYATENQIRTALKKLVTHGLIKEGCFNKNGYDRTKWYTVTRKYELLCKLDDKDSVWVEVFQGCDNSHMHDPICEKSQMDSEKSTNQSVRNHATIPNTSPDAYTSSPPLTPHASEQPKTSETPSLGGGGILDSGKNVTPSPDPVATANQDSKSDEVDKLISAIPDSSPHYVATIITKYQDKLKLKPDDIPRFAKALAEKVAQKLAENNDGQINRAASMIGGQIKSGHWTYEPKGPTVRAILTPQEREFMSECKYYEQNGMNLMPEHIKARYLEIKARIAKNKPQAKGKPANDNGCSQAIKQLVQNVRQNTASRANL